MPDKLFCYVDETGQHTYGALFVVSVVIAGKERDELFKICETIETKTGKRTKWKFYTIGQYHLVF